MALPLVVWGSCDKEEFWGLSNALLGRRVYM